jgi:dTDP-4-amino-4,6-dideoxygalactose transaminase
VSERTGDQAVNAPLSRNPDEREGPIRSEVLPLALPWIDQREVVAVNAVLGVGNLGMGPRTVEFESRFAAAVGARHAVAVNSCWAGFHLVFETLGLAPGDEVLTSVAGTTPAMAAMFHVGARPVPVDVMPDTLTLDPGAARRRLTPRTRAIVPGHFGGCPAAMDEVLALAADAGLHVVEDAIHALPATYRGRTIGSIGQVAVFGLSQDLSITTGEGGILTTDSADLARLSRTRRFYGIVEESAQPLQPPERARYGEARTYGFGYQMADLNAVVGLEQIQKIGTFHAIRSYYAGLYELGLSDLEELALPAVPAGTQHAWTLYVVRLRRGRLRIGRDAFIRLLAEENVAAGVQFVPLYAHGYYREWLGLRPDDYPNARDAYEEVVSLPLYPRMSEADVWDVIRAVRKVVAGHAAR